MCVHLDVSTGFADDKSGVSLRSVLLQQCGVDVVIVDPVISTRADDVQSVIDDIVPSLFADQRFHLLIPITSPLYLFSCCFHILHHTFTTKIIILIVGTARWNLLDT